MSLDVLADVSMMEGGRRARIVSTVRGLRIETESPRSAWSLWRSFRRYRGVFERALTQAGVGFELVVSGRVVARKDAQARSASIAPISLFRTLVGVKVATPAEGYGGTAASFHVNGATRKEREMSNEKKDTQTWPELAGGLYEQLTGRGAEISYQFDDLEVAVPSRVGEGADFAKWRLNGALRIRTQDVK